MNRNDILESLKTIDLIGIPRNGYAVTYSAALVLNGVKDQTRDIDILCDDEYSLDILDSKGYQSVPYRGGKMIKISDTIDFFSGNMQIAPEITIVDGYQVQTVQSVRTEKKSRGRDKDLADVELIDNWLLSH